MDGVRGAVRCARPDAVGARIRTKGTHRDGVSAVRQRAGAPVLARVVRTAGVCVLWTRAGTVPTETRRWGVREGDDGDVRGGGSGQRAGVRERVSVVRARSVRGEG